MSDEQEQQGSEPKADARVSGMIATYVLIFLAVFTGLLVYLSA